jgi:lipopolysaccharide biosynthesis glycosyltransferase
MKREGSVSDNAIVYILESSYIKDFQVSLYSLIKYNKISSDIIIFYDTESTKNKLEPFTSKLNVRAIYKKIDTEVYSDCNFHSINRRWEFNPAYRFEIFTLNDYNSVLYLDCDTLICGNIDELINTQCDFGACLLSPATTKYYSQGNGFNAGVLKIGKKYLQPEIRSKITAYCRDKLNLSGNQIILNKFFENKKQTLPQIYNVTTDLLTDSLLRDGKIFHFIGECKPSQHTFIESYANYVLRNTGSYLLLRLYLRYKTIEKECSLFFETI